MTLKTYSNRKDILPVILFQNNTFYCIFDQKLFLQILPTPHFWTVVYLMLTYRALLYYIVIEMVKHIIYVQVTSHNLTLITFFCFFLFFQKNRRDTGNFDKEFTKMVVELTPTDKLFIMNLDQNEFQGFSYTNPEFVIQV